MAKAVKIAIQVIVVAALAVYTVLAVSKITTLNFSWRSVPMDSHRTGVKPSAADNVTEAMGVSDGFIYTAPNGAVFEGGVTPAAAKVMLDAQPEMKAVKEKIGFCPDGMVRHRPECELSNLYADLLMHKVSELSKRKVDVSFANFGGIRGDLPKGDILMDDVLSLFPFKNSLCYLTLQGSDLRAIYEFLAEDRMQVIGGARVVVNDHKLESVEIAGEPLDDAKLYGVATIDFLLDGGDGLYIAKNAKVLEIYDLLPLDMVSEYIRNLTASGKNLEYSVDGRAVVKETPKEGENL